MLGILDRYVLREFLHYLLMGILLFLGLFIIVDLFEKIATFVDNSARAADVLLYYLYGIPYILVLTTPIAMLLASLLALGQIGRHGEILAMLSVGRSLFRMVLPILGFSVLVSAGSFVLAELIMPRASVRKEEVYQERIRQGSRAPESRKRDVTYIGRGDRLFYVKTVDPRRGMLRDVTIQQFNADRKIAFHLYAREAVYGDGAWLFRSGYVRRFIQGKELAAPFRNLWMTDIPERPEDFLGTEPDPMDMGRAGLADYIGRLKESRYRTRKFEVDYHLKLAFPVVNVIIVLLGTSLSVRIRRSGLALGFGLSIFIGFAYLALVRAGQAVGYNGGLPPLAAAWMGNLVFLTLAVALQIRANR